MTARKDAKDIDAIYGILSRTYTNFEETDDPWMTNGLSSTPLVHVHNRRAPRRFLSAEDIAAFRAKFVTPSMLMEETGLPRNTILAQLRAEGVEQYRPDGQDFGNLFPRSKAVLGFSQLSEAKQREFNFRL